jgi:cell fate regulator YaaT (PSP1 superfamily)
MYKVVGVTLNGKGKTYLFSCNKLELKKDMNVIVETERGLQYGQVVLNPYEVNEEDLGFPLKNVIRIATHEDDKQYAKNLEDAKEALLRAREISNQLSLNMRIIDANYLFDRTQLLFNFLADSRVDFREFAKKLAQIYRTRIELRQIGVRDKAKEIGGIGPCGRFLCCSTFLTDFNSVSINMAKNQMLALNPSKINGVCGRLLCCLNYEDDVYTEMKKGMPSIGQAYKNGEVEGKVVSLNLLKRTFTIETKNKTLLEVEI